MKNIIEKICELLKEADKYKKQIIIHPEVYNQYKEQFDQLVPDFPVLIHQSSFTPKDQIFIFASEKEIEREFFKPISLSEESRFPFWSYLN